MNVITSSEFRKTYHTLREPTVVTVNGHPIGTYQPSDGALILDQAPFEETVKVMKQDKGGTLFPPKR